MLISGMLVLLLSGHASAGNPREHDGFFLRLSGGGGAAQAEIEESGDTFGLSGGSGDLNIAIGHTVARNLALHGTLFGWLLSEPDLKVNGSELGSVENVDIDLTAFGGGLTYYFMPVNIYLSGSAGAATLTVDSPDVDTETDTGFFGEITLGKEWWVGGSWGLGLAGAAGFHSIPDGDVDDSWSGASFALRFTATLN
jgi:hypothetical protein